MHRFTWDMHYQPIDAAGSEVAVRSGSADPTCRLPPSGTTPCRSPTTPWVNPGTYTVKLTVNGQSYTQPIIVGRIRE